MPLSLVEELISLLEEQESFDLEKILGLILARLRRVMGTEAGTVFVSRPVADKQYNHLAAIVSQNDLVDISHTRFTVPIDLTSIVGFVASKGEVVVIDDLYDIHPEAPYSFNETFDQKNGYVSKSMLAFPLKNVHGQVIGVIQLINHIGGTNANGEVTYTRFSETDIERVKGLVTMLGALIERYDLVIEIQDLRRQLKRAEA